MSILIVSLGGWFVQINPPTPSPHNQPFLGLNLSSWWPQQRHPQNHLLNTCRGPKGWFWQTGHETLVRTHRDKIDRGCGGRRVGRERVEITSWWCWWSAEGEGGVVAVAGRNESNYMAQFTFDVAEPSATPLSDSTSPPLRRGTLLEPRLDNNNNNWWDREFYTKGIRKLFGGQNQKSMAKLGLCVGGW